MADAASARQQREKILKNLFSKVSPGTAIATFAPRYAHDLLKQIE